MFTLLISLIAYIVDAFARYTTVHCVAVVILNVSLARHVLGLGLLFIGNISGRDSNGKRVNV